MRWRPFQHGKDTYDLCHLHPHTLVYVQPSKGKLPERQYAVDISYSLHCFTHGIEDGEDPDGCLLYGDGRETRVFDFKRWELSRYLPGILQALMERKCYHTGRGNFFAVEVVDHVGNKVNYEVFFTAYKPAGKKANLRLVVQSAYVRDWVHSNRPHTKAIRFGVILFNVLNGKEIRTPQ